MRTIVLCVSASLLLAATLVPRASRAADFPVNSHQRWDARGSYSLGSESGTPTSCPMKLRPLGQCGSSGAGAEEGEDCPYQLTLPPLTIQLPKQFRLLEKTMKELQSLKEVVNKLKSGCQECRGARGSGTFGHQQADQGQTQVPIQRDAGGEVRLDLTGQEVQGGSSQEERGDGMVPGATVDVAGPGQASIFGKITPSPSSMHDMQVRGTVQFSLTKKRLFLFLGFHEGMNYFSKYTCFNAKMKTPDIYSLLRKSFYEFLTTDVNKS